MIKGLPLMVNLFLFLDSVIPTEQIKYMSKKIKSSRPYRCKLLEERKVFLWGMVDDDSAKHVIDRLLYLDALETKDIHLYINSPGGYVTSGFAMYDCIKSLNSDVCLPYVQVWQHLWVLFYYL